MRRLRLLIVPAVTAIAVSVLINQFSGSQLPDQDASSTEVLTFDAYAESINSVLFDETGAIDYTLQATRQVHYRDDSTELEQPFIQLFKDGSSRWNITADSGRISAGPAGLEGTNQRSIELSGQVEVFNVDDYGNRSTLTTDYLQFDPQLETLQTNSLVTYQTNTIQQTALGLFANLEQERIQFHNDVRGSYVQMEN